MDKKFFIVLILISLVFAMGCTNIGRIKDVGLEDRGDVQKGTLNGTVLINGKPSTQLELISEQSGHIGLNLRNNGIREIRNITVGAFGCVDAESFETAKNIAIAPYGTYYFSWNIKAPALGRTEIIKCPISLRVCFNYVTRGRTDLVLIPENYKEVPPSPNVATSGDFLEISHNFGVTRVIPKKNNEIVGQLSLKNIGDGWVDYANYTGTNLSINTIKQIKLQIVETPGIEIQKYGELNSSNMVAFLSGGNKTFTINGSNAGNFIYMLRMTQGRELNSRVVLSVVSPDLFQKGLEVGTLETEIEHGYCMDIATINTVLRGR